LVGWLVSFCELFNTPRDDVECVYHKAQQIAGCIPAYTRLELLVPPCCCRRPQPPPSTHNSFPICYFSSRSDGGLHEVVCVLCYLTWK
jgi:hypothetical protein